MLFDSTLSMLDNYEERKIARFENNDVKVSTACVSDSDWPIETAVAHRLYHQGRWIVVEGYLRREDAVAGHKKWVEVMTSETLPEQLADIGTSGVATILRRLAPEMLHYEQEET